MLFIVVVLFWQSFNQVGTSIFPKQKQSGKHTKETNFGYFRIKKKKKCVNVWQISTTREGQHQVWVEKL